MTVREYIGARYVPLFMGEWSDETSYEPLSIVQYQGNSYTSRQHVPIGIDILNETYWAITGNYNAQIEAYRQEVANLSDKLPGSEFDSTNTVKNYIDEETRYDFYANAKDFGAKGDGVTDDTAILQYLLDNFPGVYLPKADPYYKVTQLTLHSRNHLLGCGQDSLIQSSLSNGDFIIVTDANAERPIVEKIRIIGNYNMSGIRFVSTNLDIQTASKVIDCNIEKVIDGIKFDQYQTECVVDRTIITGASHDGIIAPTSDCKFCNTTVGLAGHVGFNFRDSTQIHISDCKAYECGGNTTEDTYGLGSDGYGVWINTYSIITNLALEGMFHNGLLMRYGNIVAGLEINSINYVTHEGETTDIDSYGVVFENSGNIVQGVMIDGIYSYGDYIIGETQQTENHVVDLALVKRTNQHSSGSTHIVTNNPNQNFANNTVKINGKTVYGEFLTANRLYGGVELPSTANLNDYTKYGNYYYSSSNVSQMTNCPATSGFVMKVESALGPGSGAYQYIRQTLQQYNAPFTTFTRVYTMSAQTFSQWYKVTPEVVA